MELAPSVSVTKSKGRTSADGGRSINVSWDLSYGELGVEGGAGGRGKKSLSADRGEACGVCAPASVARQDPKVSAVRREKCGSSVDRLQTSPDASDRDGGVLTTSTTKSTTTCEGADGGFLWRCLSDGALSGTKAHPDPAAPREAATRYGTTLRARAMARRVQQLPVRMAMYGNVRQRTAKNGRTKVGKGGWLSVRVREVRSFVGVGRTEQNPRHPQLWTMWTVKVGSGRSACLRCPGRGTMRKQHLPIIPD
jgi:hypothetical protein